MLIIEILWYIAFFFPDADAGSYDLLPRPNAGEQWTKSLTTDTGNESDQIYQFDGRKDAVIVPSQFAPPDNLTDQFSISFWMKHRNVVGGDPEYVICKSDSKGMFFIKFLHKVCITDSF